MKDQRGLTLVELLIATAIMLTIVATTFLLVNHAQGIFAAQPEATEMQQRLRVGIEMLSKDVMMAGAGIDYFPAVMPYRLGAVAADPAGSYFSDRVTLVYVPPTSAQTRIADPVGSLTPVVSIDSMSGCPTIDASCGFQVGMAVVVMDTRGAWDAFTVTDVQGAILHLQHRGPQLNNVYEGGSFISQVATYTYWLKSDQRAGVHQLMRYDGNRSDVPVADNVVGLRFEYFGETVPPAGSADLVALTEEELTDGPWLPDAASPQRYDADLRRVRRVAMTLRVQAPSTFRGPAGALFTLPGSSKGGERFLPDQEIRFDVSPRNLGGRR